MNETYELSYTGEEIEAMLGQIGDIKTALEEIIALQEELMAL